MIVIEDIYATLALGLCYFRCLLVNRDLSIDLSFSPIFSYIYITFLVARVFDYVIIIICISNRVLARDLY